MPLQSVRSEAMNVTVTPKHALFLPSIRFQLFDQNSYARSSSMAAFQFVPSAFQFQHKDINIVLLMTCKNASGG